MSDDYTLKFRWRPYQQLDKFALLADQGYNFGDKGNWFFEFRCGLEGLYIRLLGVRIHYHEVHSWTLPRRRLNENAEYHISSIFFNMDSAIECMVYTLNALGYAVNSTQFLDLTDEKALAKIAPWNILGRRRNNRDEAIKGYDNYFPSLKSCWIANRDLISKISEQHDVSKHRKTIFEGGRMRTDPPQGFFESLGVGSDKGDQLELSPMAEILLRPKPKIPIRQLQHSDTENRETLEDLAENFCTFINNSGVKALEDARNKIKLNHYEFLK